MQMMVSEVVLCKKCEECRYFSIYSIDLRPKRASVICRKCWDRFYKATSQRLGPKWCYIFMVNSHMLLLPACNVKYYITSVYSSSLTAWFFTVLKALIFIHFIPFHLLYGWFFIFNPQKWKKWNCCPQVHLKCMYCESRSDGESDLSHRASDCAPVCEMRCLGRGAEVKPGRASSSLAQLYEESQGIMGNVQPRVYSDADVSTSLARSLH